MKIISSYHLTTTLAGAIALKAHAERFRAQFVAENSPKVEIDMYVESKPVEGSSTNFEVNVAGIKVYAEFDLITVGAEDENELRGRFRFRTVDAFGNIGAAVHTVIFDENCSTGMKDFAYLLYSDQMGRSVRNTHLNELAKAVLTSIPHESN